MKKISEHCSYKEGIRSTTADRMGIDNIPNEEQLENMKVVAEKLFEPIREFMGRPIRVNSFFRCPELNKAIGGSPYSQHCKGQAMDIDIPYGDNPNAEMYHFVKDNLDFDQMIWEFGDDKNPNWVHISWVSHRPNRKQEVIAIKKNGRTKYIKNIEEYLKGR